MLIFRLRQNYVRTSGPKKELALVRDLLTLPVQNAFFRRRRRGWDGKIRFFGWLDKRFPSGLWPQVRHFCKANNIEFRALRRKRRSLDNLRNNKIGSITLDRNQVDSCNAWLSNGGNGIVWAGAGFGKTEVAAKLIHEMFSRDLVKRVLFIVNTLDLLDQATERLKARLRVPIGTIDNPLSVTVALIQALDNRIKQKDRKTLGYLKTVDMLVYDEVHHGKSEQSGRLSKMCPAYYRLGLSARPLYIGYETYQNLDMKDLKADDARVLSFLGPIVIRIPPSVLIRSGRLARPTIYFYPLGYKDYLDDDSPLEGLDWPAARRELIVRNRVIHNVSRKVALEATRAGETSLIVTGGSKELGLHIYKELRDANLNVAYLHGGIKKDVRTKSRHKLTNKKLDAIIATTIYDEGIDVPRLRLLILSYGGLSPYKTEQRLGRGLREKLGSNEAVIIDFMHYSNKHLRKHSYARLRQYLEEEQYKIKLVTHRHTRHVIKLVGVHNIVGKLPKKKLFMRLKYGSKHKDRDQAA